MFYGRVIGGSKRDTNTGMKRIYFLFLFLAFMSPWIASSASAEGPDPIRIGGLFCLTGEIAQGCNAIREGAEIAVTEINEKGGILGRTLELDIQDSAYTPKGAHMLAQKFSADPRILGVVITGVVETKAAGSVLETAHLPNITVWDSTPEIEAIGEYAFGIGPWLPSTYEVSAEFAAKELNAKTAATLATNSEWSLLVQSGFEKEFKSLGGKIIESNASSPTEADYRTPLLRALNKKPDVIYAPVTSHILTFFRQARQLGFKGPIITSDNLNEQEIELDKTVFEGVFQSLVTDPETENAHRLKKLYEETHNRPARMLIYYAWGYDGVGLLAEAIRKSTLTRESVGEQLRLLKDYPGALGNISFTPEGSWKMRVKMFRVADGRFVALK